MKLEINILSWLLHHANLAGKDEHFYKIKNRLLAKYGRLMCYDVQFIEGSKCWSCNGTGKYKYPKYDYATGYYYEPCHSCYNGWYKRPIWNILSRIRFGKYSFHQPFQRVYERPVLEATQIIEGYIDHKKSKYTNFAKTVIFLMFEKGYLKRWYRMTGNGWRCYWYWPRNWVPCTIHIIKHGRNSFPFRNFINKRIVQKYSIATDADDLPF